MSTWQPTEQTFLVALLHLVSALAERLTGERPEVRLTDANGDSVWTAFGDSSDGPPVRWIKAATEVPLAGPPAPRHTLAVQPSVPHAIPPTPGAAGPPSGIPAR